MTKKKKVLLSVLLPLAVLLLATAIILWVVFRPVTIPPRGELDSQTVCYELPADGSTPMDHTGVENIGYMNWKLQHQSYWYSEMNGVVDTIDKQKVTTYKQFHDGVMISTDIATSNLVNSAVQLCTVDGVVLMRFADCKPSAYNGINTKWKSGQPVGYTFAEYKAAMGLPHTEFSVYILNENTILQCSDVIYNGDGTYTQSFTLNMASDPMENDAGYYYKQQMIYKGGLHGDPEFSEVVITYTFDSQWQVLSMENREVYKVNKGFAASCVATGLTQYVYDDEQLCNNPDYENYFKDYVSSYAPPAEKELTAADCLAEAFGGVMQDESKLAVNLTLDQIDLSGIVQLNLEQNDIRVDLGDIKLYIRTEADAKQYLYISYGQNIKAKISLTDITADSPVAMEAEAEEASVLDNLLAALGDEEQFTLADDKLSATLTPTLDLGELLGVDLDILLNLEFKFNISEQKAVTLDYVKACGDVLGLDLLAELTFTEQSVDALTQDAAAEYTQISPELIPAIQNLVGEISSGRLSVSGSLEIGGASIALDNLAISWVDGIDVKAQITIDIDGLVKTVYIDYNKEKITLYYDQIAVELAQSDVEGLAQAIQNLYQAIADEVGDDAVWEPDIQALLAIIFAGAEGSEGEDFNILDILNSIVLFENENGHLAISYGDFTLELYVNGEGNLVTGLAYGADITANVTVTGYVEVEFPTDSFKMNVAELIPLIEDITDVINNKGITLSGKISLGEDTVLTLYGLSVSWANGIELQLDARLEVDGAEHDFYAQYSAATDELKIVYGALDSGMGIAINVENDVQTLETALVALYNRIAGVVNKIANDQILPEVESLAELLDLISTGKDAASGFATLAETLDEIEKEQPSIADILGAIEIKGKDGRLEVDMAGLTLTLWSAEDGFNISVQTEVFGFEISDARIVATEATDFGIQVEKALSAEDIADVLDYIAATVELLATDSLKIELSGTVTSTDEAYAKIENNVKYDIEAGFEYSQGENGFPIHVDTETPDFWIDPDIYVHVWVNMISTIDEVDSVILDAYILDGNPTIGEDGKTTKDALASGNNELDLYLSISCIPERENGELTHEPLMVYAPMNEVMTVLSAGLALVDVGSISIDALPELNGVITQIGQILDVMLVDRYFGNIKDQFKSVGAGLLETLLGGSISDILNGVIVGAIGGEQPEEQEIAAMSARTMDGGFARDRQGMVSLDISRDNGVSTLTLGVGQTTSTVEKANTEKGSRITNLTVDATALNDAEILNNLNIDLSYNQIERVTTLAGYTSFVGADALIMALVNSATHEIPAEEQTEDGASYALNNSFFIDGTLNISIGQLKNHNVVIDGLHVAIGEDGEVEVNARFHYIGMSLLIPLVNGTSTVDLTIKNGMVYMKRVQTTNAYNKAQTPETIYRAMPIEVFTGDILNQIGFMLNFSNTILSMFNMGGDSEPTVEVKKDYGTQLAEYFNYLTFKEDMENGTASWVVQINGTGISNLAGIKISDINANFSAVKDNKIDNYIITKLSLNGALFSILNFGADLDWQNPQQQWRVLSTADNGDGTFTEVTAEGALSTITENDPSINLEKWLGGASFEDICRSIDWNKLPNTTTVESKDENGDKVTKTYHYVELSFTGDAELPGGTVKFGTVEFYIDNGEETLISSVENILYYGATLLSIVEYPDLEEYELEHYEFEWRISSVGGGVKLVAVYVPAQYEVTFDSEYEIEGYTHTYGNTFTFDFTYETEWHKIDYIEYNGVQYTAENYDELIIDCDAEIFVHWVEIPAVFVTYASEYEVEGFTYNEVSGYWENVKKYRTDREITLESEYIIDGYEFTGYIDVNGDPVEDITLTLTEDTTYFLQWKGNSVNVVYYSALQYEGSSEVNGIEGYESAYTSTVKLSNEYATANVSAEGYLFLGWYYLGADGWIIVEDVMEDIPNASAGSTYELHALWAAVTVEGSGTYTTSRVLFATYYNYKLNASVSVEFVGNADLVNKVTLSSATFSFAVADKTASASSNTLAEGKLSVSDVAPDRTTKSANTASVTVTFKIVIDGKTVDSNWSATQNELPLTAA